MTLLRSCVKEQQERSIFLHHCLFHAGSDEHIKLAGSSVVKPHTSLKVSSRYASRVTVHGDHHAHLPDPPLRRCRKREQHASSVAPGRRKCTTYVRQSG